MIDLNLDPSKKDLKVFGTAFLVASILLGGILAWRIGLGTFSYALWIAGPIVAVVGFAFPKALKPLYIALTVLAWPIGMVIGTILLGLTYYLVVTAVGLVFRLLGKDPMHRRFDRKAESYWIRRRPITDVSRYFRQF